MHCLITVLIIWYCYDTNNISVRRHANIGLHTSKMKFPGQLAAWKWLHIPVVFKFWRAANFSIVCYATVIHAAFFLIYEINKLFESMSFHNLHKFLVFVSMRFKPLLVKKVHSFLSQLLMEKRVNICRLICWR